MTDWLFTWKARAVGVVTLLVAVALGILLRDSSLGNVASIVGLAVSVLGFVVTIWTVLDARHQIKDASNRAEEAIAEATEETQRAVRGLASQLRAADCAVLRGGVEDLRQAAQDMKWARAVYRCQECRPIAFRLAHDEHLTGEERGALYAAADDLLLILRFIEKNRMEGQPGLLRESHVQGLDRVIGLLAQIQARFHHEPLRRDDSR
jgi:hypothetical protein